MRVQDAVELITKYDVLILGYSPRRNSLIRVETMADTFRRYIPDIINEKRIKVNLVDGKLMLKYIIWDVGDLIGVTADKRDRNILYIQGKGFAAALYLIK